MKYLIIGSLSLWMGLGCWLVENVAQTFPPRSAVARTAPNYVGISFGDHAKVRANIFRMAESFGGMAPLLTPLFPLTSEGVADLSWGSISYLPIDTVFDINESSLTILRLSDLDLLDPGQPFAGFNKERWCDLGKIENLPDNNTLPRWLSPILFPPLDESWGKHHGAGRCTFSSFENLEEADAILNSQPLSELLDEPGLSVIDQYGISVFSSDIKRWLSFDDFDPRIDDSLDSLAEAEAVWLKKLQEVADSVVFGIMGINYHAELLEIQAEVTLENEHLLDGVFDMAATQETWQPTLGLEAQDLLVAGCIQLDVFPTPAAARSLPLYLFQVGSKKKTFQFLQGSLSQVVGELTGDIWTHLSVVRLALYENPESSDRQPGLGDVALIMVADTKNQKAAIEELRFLTSLRSPMTAAERTSQLEEQIADLIGQLSDHDEETCWQAQTRLRLVGPAAIPALQKAADRSDPRLRSRARYILGELQKAQDQAKKHPPISDPYFWTSINPGLEFLESNSRIDDHECHVIQLSPDPSKTAIETEQATTVLRKVFGDQWDQVKVVPVKDKLVLMLGSDEARLQRVVRDVQQGHGHLREQFEGQLTGTQEATFHCFFNPIRIVKFLKLNPPFRQDVPDSLGWFSLRLRERVIAKKLVISANQFPFFMSWLGF